MKDFTPMQKLLMATSLFLAVTFAVVMSVPADPAAPSGTSTVTGMLRPF